MRVYRETSKLVLPASTGRSPGLHASETIRDLAVHGKVLDAKWVRPILIEEQNTNMMQLGMAFESYLEYSRQHPEIKHQPGEFDCALDVCWCGHERWGHDANCMSCGCAGYRPASLFMTPDGLSLIRKADYPHLVKHSSHFIHEIKFTLKSSRDVKQHLEQNNKKFRMWLWQIACYCHAAGTLAAKLHAMFVAGDYSYSDSDEARAAYHIYRLEFTPEDIASTWAMIKQHSITMLRDGRYQYGLDGQQQHRTAA